MIKANKGNIEFKGSASTLVGEACTVIAGLLPMLAENDKAAAISGFRTLGRAMADTAKELCEKYGIELERLNDEDEDEDEENDKLREFISSLSEKEAKALLAIVEKYFGEDD